MISTGAARRHTAWLWYGILFLFFFRLLADFVAAVYAFGLLGTNIPPEIAAVLLFGAPIVLLLRRRVPGERAQTALLVMTLAAGVVEIFLDTRGRMFVAGLGVASFLVLLPTWLWTYGERREPARAAELGAGVSVGLVLSICLRAWNSGVDPAPQSMYRLGSIVLAMAAFWLFWRQSRVPDRASNSTESPRPRFLTIAGLALGWMAALTLLYFAFVSPNVIARWTSSSYLLILGVILLALTLFVVAFKRLLHISRRVILIWNAAFVIALTATLLAHQIHFPLQAAGYPFPEPDVPAWAAASLLVMCALFPVILLDFSLYSLELIARRPSSRAVGGAFLLAALFLLIMIFAQVFTTVYDYIPVVGPVFRDQFWAVILIVGLVLMLPLGLIRTGERSGGESFSRLAVGLVVASAAIALVGAWWPLSPASSGAAALTGLRVLTYNIQQGYNVDGQLNYLGQLGVIQRANPDIIGLQESDTNRIANNNSDLVRYFADHLGYNAYYGPEVVPGTFGIALLSRYPIENPRTIYLYSAGEQTAAIIAQIGGFNVFVTHLGNGGPIVQQQAFLQAIDGSTSVIAVGDFNFEPDTDQYRLTRARLDDAWLTKWPQGTDDQGFKPSNSIDHIFLSPGTLVTDARYLTTADSDHPALLVEIK